MESPLLLDDGLEFSAYFEVRFEEIPDALVTIYPDLFDYRVVMDLSTGLGSMLGKLSPLVNSLEYILPSLQGRSIKVLLQGLVISHQILSLIQHVILYFLLLG